MKLICFSQLDAFMLLGSSRSGLPSVGMGWEQGDSEEGRSGRSGTSGTRQGEQEQPGLSESWQVPPWGDTSPATREDPHRPLSHPSCLLAVWTRARADLEQGQGTNSQRSEWEEAAEPAWDLEMYPRAMCFSSCSWQLL